MGKNIVDYTTVEEYDSESLVSTVYMNLKEGWQPFGSPYVIADEEGDQLVGQALVKYEHK